VRVRVVVRGGRGRTVASAYAGRATAGGSWPRLVPAVGRLDEEDDVVGRTRERLGLSPSRGAAPGGREDGALPAPRSLSSLRQAVTRYGSREEMHAVDEQAESAREGGRPCALLGDRHRVLVVGTLRSVTLRPRAGTPALEAEVFDGSGALSVIWLGRREIAGVEAGRRIKVEGLVSVVDSHAVMYNPRYELLPTAAPARS